MLDRILKHLADRIVGLDSRYATRRQESVLAFRSKVASLADDVASALGTAPGVTNEDYKEFQRLFDEIWRQITYSLTVLLRELRVHRDESDADDRAEVDRIQTMAEPELAHGGNRGTQGGKRRMELTLLTCTSLR